MTLEQYKKSQAYFKNMQSIFNEHVIYSMTDLQGIITVASEAFCHETGYEKDDIIGRSHSFLRSEDTSDTTYDDLWYTINNDEIWEGQIKNVKKNGEVYWVNTIIEPVFNSQNEKIGYMAIRQDITKEKLCEAQSMTDELTGAYNRRKFNTELNLFLINYYRYKDSFSIVMMDIDYFKKFNDMYGHLIGDEVLKEVCRTLNAHIRQGDIFARWGGEEFMLLLNKTDKALAMEIVDKLVEQLHLALPAYLFKNFNITEELTCSLGITSPIEEDSIDSLLGRVDRALYQAKSNGRNRVESL